jgi:8-amino-7-oxononanoate synthase
MDEMKEIWDRFIQADLTRKREADQFRELKILSANSGRQMSLEGKTYLNFASNNYLGLANDPRITEAGIRAAREWGAGSGAARLITGSTSLFSHLEEELAAWTGKERALVFNSGYTANLGLLSGLADRDTCVFCDRLNHASIYDAIALSRAQLIRYPHCDTEKLGTLLAEHGDRKKIIITDTVFSMDGDRAPLRRFSELAEATGSLLVADEAHSIGVFGDQGQGLTGELGLAGEVDVILGTLSKAFGVFGAFVAGPSPFIDFLVNNSRPFIFTTALPPFVPGAAARALSIIRTEGRGRKLLEVSSRVVRELNKAGWDTGDSSSQIIPVIAGSNRDALDLAGRMRDLGLYVPAIRPPTVPPNTARLRISLSHCHTEEDINRLLEGFAK